MTAIASRSTAGRSAGSEPDTFPETVQVTDATISAWRIAGYAVSERRKANWLYLLARGNGNSAVYKMVGPRFHGPTPVYDGFRVA